MDPIEMLKKDHKEVKALFREYEGAGDTAYKTKQQIAEKVISELRLHSKLEEQIFYPAVQKKADEEGKDLVLEGIEEHHVVATLMDEIAALQPEDETYDAKFKVLTENVEHHIEEEEGELFPDAKKALGDELDAIGDKMAALKKQLQAQPA